MAKLLSKNASERNGVAKTCILLVPDNNFFPFFVIYGTQFVKIPPQMKMHFEVIARMKSYYTVIFDQKHLTFTHPNRDHNSNLHVFHWIRSHVKYNYDADYMTACLFYITRFHYLAHHEIFTGLKWEVTAKVSFCQILPWNGIMELYRLVHWNYSCYPMELRSAGVAQTRPGVDLAWRQ